MTDFFVLFDQPRRPWLDSGVLKEKYYQLTRVAHPDVRARESAVKFEEVNAAYRVLSDPKLRIQHLLTLEGQLSAAADRALPEDLEETFLQIGALSQNVRRALARMGGGSGALTLSLVKHDLLQLRPQIARLLEQLSESYESCVAELQGLNQMWDENRSAAMFQLQALRDRMTYLSRWMAQLKEMELQLVSHD